MPAALQHKAVHRLRVTVARKHTRLAHTQKVHPIASAGGEAERAKPHIFHLRYPQALVLRYGVGDDEFRIAFLGLRVPVGNPRFSDSAHVLEPSLSYCCITSIDGQDGSGDETGCFRTKKNRGSGDVSRLAPTMHRR